jgi:hypothetical protein
VKSNEELAAELIAEMDAEARRHGRVLPAIGFEHSSISIEASLADRLQLLVDAVNMGGMPIGLDHGRPNRALTSN